MSGRRPKALAPLLALLAACSSVELPQERFYRLELPPAAAPDPQRGGVLRVHDLQLHAALDSDCLQRLHGVRLEPRPLARWTAPLDRLVTDALVLGLSRARVCDLVKGGADPGDETWSLRGRLLEFAETVAGGERRARVQLELWLEQRDRVLFHEELTVDEPISAPGDDGAVAALSRAVGAITAGVVARMRGQDLFAAARAAAAQPGLAAPGR
jgi:uncharacterized lipoprotein YmbA